MNYRIETDIKTPAYIQLYDHLKNDIVKGIYKYGDKLPSKRIIAADTGLSVITVQHAADLLQEEGYIETRERSGCFVIFKAGDFIGTGISVGPAPIAASEPIKTGSGDFPFSVLSKCMRKVLSDHGERILERSPSFGLLELREAICSYLARSRAMEADPSQVIIGAGAEYLYNLIAQVFRSEKIFAIEKPSYDRIRAVYSSYDIECDELTLRSDGIDSKELKNSKARILHTTPFNSYPSGVTVDVSKKHEYLAWAKERNGIIIEDNYDSELTVSHKPEESLFAMAGGNGVIYLNTFSQTISPAVRIGYMLIPKDMQDIFSGKTAYRSCPVPVFEQYVLTELISSGDFERHINRVRRKKRKMHI